MKSIKHAHGDHPGDRGREGGWTVQSQNTAEDCTAADPYESSTQAAGYTRSSRCSKPPAGPLVKTFRGCSESRRSAAVCDLWLSWNRDRAARWLAGGATGSRPPVACDCPTPCARAAVCDLLSCRRERRARGESPPNDTVNITNCDCFILTHFNRHTHGQLGRKHAPIKANNDGLWKSYLVILRGVLCYSCWYWFNCDCVSSAYYLVSRRVRLHNNTWNVKVLLCFGRAFTWVCTILKPQKLNNLKLSGVFTESTDVAAVSLKDWLLHGYTQHFFFWHQPVYLLKLFL